MNIPGDVIDIPLSSPDIRNILKEIHGAEREGDFIQLTTKIRIRLPLKVTADPGKDLFNAEITRGSLSDKILYLHNGKKDASLCKGPASDIRSLAFALGSKPVRKQLIQDPDKKGRLGD